MMKLHQQHILITGGTGSYGQALVKKLLHEFSDVKAVTVFSRDEYKQYEIQRSFPKAQFPALQCVIGDVRDQDALFQATKGVDIVIHAAALKQNISGEQYADEFIKTNVEGTRHLIKAAVNNEVKKVLLVSTDKAVYPTTLYGASKLCAEKLLLSANTSHSESSLFSVLRLGNLFGSRGSISSALNHMLKEDALHITDPEMTRFSLTIEDSIRHTLKVLEHMNGGEIFIPKMDAYRLGDLIQALKKDIKMISSGPRLTEKMHEISLSSEEARFSVQWEDFFVFVSPQLRSNTYWQNTGSAVPHDFEYSSLSVPKLNFTELKQLIDTQI